MRDNIIETRRNWQTLLIDFHKVILINKVMNYFQVNQRGYGSPITNTDSTKHWDGLSVQIIVDDLFLKQIQINSISTWAHWSIDPAEHQLPLDFAPSATLPLLVEVQIHR